jgi:hypothetical protein
MDIVLGQKEQQDLVSFVNTIPTEFGRPLLNWWDSMVAKARQAEAARQELEKAKPATEGSEIANKSASPSESTDAEAPKTEVKKQPIIRKLPKK